MTHNRTKQPQISQVFQTAKFAPMGLGQNTSADLNRQAIQMPTDSLGKPTHLQTDFSISKREKRSISRSKTKKQSVQYQQFSSIEMQKGGISQIISDTDFQNQPTAPGTKKSHSPNAQPPTLINSNKTAAASNSTSFPSEQIDLGKRILTKNSPKLLVSNVSQKNKNNDTKISANMLMADCDNLSNATQTLQKAKKRQAKEMTVDNDFIEKNAHLASTRTPGKSTTDKDSCQKYKKLSVPAKLENPTKSNQKEESLQQSNQFKEDDIGSQLVSKLGMLQASNLNNKTSKRLKTATIAEDQSTDQTKNQQLLFKQPNNCVPIVEEAKQENKQQLMTSLSKETQEMINKAQKKQKKDQKQQQLPQATNQLKQQIDKTESTFDNVQSVKKATVPSRLGRTNKRGRSKTPDSAIGTIIEEKSENDMSYEDKMPIDQFGEMDTPVFSQHQEQQPIVKPNQQYVPQIAQPTQAQQILSAKTQALVAAARNKKQNQTLSPIPHLLAQQRQIQAAGQPQSTQQTNKFIDLKLKHAELLKSTRELIMPLKYKNLIRQVNNLDQTMIFLKECRKQEVMYFSEIAECVKKTFSREMNISILQQILAICPDLFVQGWQNQKITLEAAPIGVDLRQESVREERRNTLHKRLLSRTMIAHEEWCQEKGVYPGDVIETQVWSKGFDPHEMVPDIEMAALAPIPHAMLQKANRVSSLVSYMQRTDAQTQRNLSERQSNMRPPTSTTQPNVASEPPATSDRIRQLANSTGLSIETLEQIKRAEDQISQRNQEQEKVLATMDEKRIQQQMFTLASQIRQVFLFRGNNFMKLIDLCEALSSNRSALGDFNTKTDRKDLVRQLAVMCPEWIQVKEAAGQICVRVNSKISNHEVQSKITNYLKLQKTKQQNYDNGALLSQQTQNQFISQVSHQSLQR